MEASDRLHTPAHLAPGKEDPVHSIGDCALLRAGLDVVVGKEALSPTGNRTDVLHIWRLNELSPL
jgi:hypothetical protein